MSIELPSEVVWVLNLLGLPWPSVDEDEMRACATHLRDYATSLSGTHDTAYAEIKALSASYSSPSYEILAERWAHFSTTYVPEVVDACRVFATALDVAADAVVAAKGAIIGALVAMAAEMAADQAAAVATLGIAEAAIPALIGATRLIVKDMLDQLEQQLLAEVLQAALTPLEDKIASALQNMVLQGVEAALA
jgi:plasmid maintenance system antidote protein VapI